MIDSIDSYLKGLSFDAYETMGAHLRGGGAQFVTYAPNAVNVELMLNGSMYDMHRDGSGVWSCTRDGVRQGDIYQYVITTKTLEKHYRSDPFAFYSEVRPKNASIIYDIDSYSWSDDAWLSSRDKNYEKPMNIYEMHFGSWRIKEGRTQTDRFYTYAEMADILIPYIKEMGYTHIELLPLTEHPFDGSWGYQATGYYSATSRYGDPNGLKSFIDKCHGAGIGVILDFVPVHFARDFFALHIYDGGFVFESDNENERYSEWNTALFDYSKPHVVSFMKSAVNFWIEKYHVDGIRFDAVANLIFRHGRKDMPIKWDLGFMNDTINYIKTPPNERSKHHNKMTFSMSYFYSDLFILPYSHDEVVHGKGTMLDKAQGDHDQKMATIRAFYMWQMTHPGKKLNFMGNELGEYMEWREEKELGWNLLTYPSHDSLHEYIKKLDQLYLTEPALYKYDYNAASFRWVDVNNSGRNIFAFQRNDLAGHLIYCVFNFSANRQSYTLNVNANGEYEEMLNSDRDIYSGSNCLNEHCFANGYKLNIKLAPLSAVMLRKK